MTFRHAVPILSVLIVCGFACAAGADEISIEGSADVFVSGTGGYHTFRIPSVVAAPNGDLLAFCEGRRGSRGDAGDIDLVMRRSSDGGRNWSDLIVVRDDGANTCGNPCPVIDRETGTILLLTTHNLGRDHESAIINGTSEATRTVWIQRSTDDGHTWSAPENITAATKQPDWTWYATGPGAGIQLERGGHAGRLVIPCDHIEAGTRHYYSHVIYSDDHGATWTLGGSTPQHQVNECEVVELVDGQLMLNMRNYERVKKTRQVCASGDGGLTWTDQRHDANLVEPICQASIRRIAWPTGDGAPGLVAFSNPASGDARVNMTLRLSRDDAKTWSTSFPLHAGSSAYSCLVALVRGGIGCLFEADDYARIVFTRVTVTPRPPASERWPPRHDLDEAVGAAALAACRSTWDDAASWTRRAEAIRAHLLETLGLAPEADRPPVSATVHSRRALDGYAVANTLLETAPGLFVAANVYEPVDRPGRHPLVLAAHGHYRRSATDGEGRFRHDYQKLCAALARCGAVVVAWDMVGWAETRTLPHAVPATTILQTWNTMRVLDWALARDDVDAARVGMTGSSGGGTQTFLGAAVDRRIAVTVPVVMVSAHFFGGCPCESGLPIHDGPDARTNNVELAALAAPRPQLIVSCGGDWTRNTPSVEFPYLQDVYTVLAAGDRCANVHLGAEGHDYGTSKRAATIRFLARHLGFDADHLFDDKGGLADGFVTLLDRDALCAITLDHPLPEAVQDHAAALDAIRGLAPPQAAR